MASKLKKQEPIQKTVAGTQIEVTFIQGISRRKVAMTLLGGGGLVLLGLRFMLTEPSNDLEKEPQKDLIGVLLPSPRELLPFSLMDHDGNPFVLDRLVRQWTFLFFGYTHCPDVCPLSMALLAEVFGILAKTPKTIQGVRGVFVTVDPNRDTPPVLKEYLPFFHPDFLGITGTPTAIQTFAKQLGAYYSTVPGNESTEQTISHASVFYLMDPRGRFAALFQPQRHTPVVMADLFIKIRQHYGEEL